MPTAASPTLPDDTPGGQLGERMIELNLAAYAESGVANQPTRAQRVKAYGSREGGWYPGPWPEPSDDDV
jgi:hypothetical protein